MRQQNSFAAKDQSNNMIPDLGINFSKSMSEILEVFDQPSMDFEESEISILNKLEFNEKIKDSSIIHNSKFQKASQNMNFSDQASFDD